MEISARADVVAALRAVPGVADAEIRAADGVDPVGTLHVTLRPGADEVAVATDVNQVLRDRFGLAVDSRRVRVVDVPTARPPQVPDPVRHLSAVDDPVDTRAASEPAEPLASADRATIDLRDRPDLLLRRGDRLLIQRMQLVSSADGVSVAVTLGLGGTTHVGESTGSASETGVLRSAAEATLRAAESATGSGATFVLEVVDVVDLGAERAVLVQVLMTSPLGTEKLTGASTVREDVRQAVIRATLDSLNRRIGTLTGA